MPHSLKVITAAIVLFAMAVSLRADSTCQAETLHGVVLMSPLAMIADDGAPSPSPVSPATRPGSSSPTMVDVPQRTSRSWLLLPFGVYTLPVLILAVILFFKHQRLRMMHETLRAMIEKGMPVTPELIATLKPDARSHPMCYLLPGLILSAVGIGLMVNSGRSGLIPLLIGVAFLIAWQVEKRSTRA